VSNAVSVIAAHPREVTWPAMATPRNPVWAEIAQLVPIISLALPFIVAGKVDLDRAGSGFLLGALLTVPISAAVVMRKHLLNPILIGTGLWLWLGAIAFQFHVAPLAEWLTRTQAFGLFVAALGAGIAATLLSPWGYIACGSSDPRWNRKASLSLLGFTLVIVGWAWLFRHDIRLGGGLPFIVLNVVRRWLGRSAPRASPAAQASGSA
jgi:hypothetical protein